MLSVRDIPLPEEARLRLESLVAAGAPARGLWQRLAGAADRKFRERRAEAARAALASGTCQAVHVRHDAPPAVSEHEHGLFVFVPAASEATLLLDVSSVSEDPRWDLHRAGGLMRAEWRWLRLIELDGPSDFAVDGPAVTPIALPFFHGTALERRLTEEMEWPGDDALLPLALDEIARLAAAPADTS
jgi:hypothetical protein